MTSCCALVSLPLSTSHSSLTNSFCSITPHFFRHTHLRPLTYQTPTAPPCLLPSSPIVTKRRRRRKREVWVGNSGISTESQCRASEPANDFVVVNFYRFVLIEEPHVEVAKHLSFLEGLDIHGRIYLNEQGINAQYSGPFKDALAYVEWLKEDYRFSDVLVQISPSVNGHAFPKLKLRYKPSLVQMEGGIQHLPLLDPSMRATPMTPSQWKIRLQALHEKADISKSVHDSSFVLLDVRNSYEWDIGHFHGAKRPDVDCFRRTSFTLSYNQVISTDPLADIDKEKTDILMYCTGGIRCDVYSTILRQQGFQNLYTLMGGVSHYLKNEGPVKWIGNLFVFDDRLSLPPSAYNHEVKIQANDAEVAAESNSFASCYICGLHVRDLRHRNCANLNCNLLFLCCEDCLKDLRGCCCLKCTTAPWLRPVLPGNERYKKWHTYREAR
ncbi:hypothetical protein K2173_007584 [Erythroxylum novogranatense]|uniref:Rhodanese domain-containing protein n=1 Tax=Erythroxylum novogranatense TaxID=1862640 RepID=A0AAV8S928_9ROSI|nr:hypothetical protein K2173_007584 [Erythroxylum novogranatense]